MSMSQETEAPAVALSAHQRRPGFMARLLSQPTAALALVWVVMLVIVAIFAEQLAPHDPNTSSVMRRLQGPSATNWLGTDDLGRDLLSRVMWGSRIALLAVVQSVGPALLVGVPLGLFVAYKGGWWDRIVMRLADVEQTIPMLLFAFSFIAIFGRGLTVAMLAISIGFAMSFLRLSRAIVLAERNKPYVQAAEVLGYSTLRILFRHILPNAVGPIMVQVSILFGVAILLETMLSFLGLGVTSGSPSWGAMLDDARRFQIQQPMLSLVPGAAITITVLAFNMLGDGIRDAVNSDVVGKTKAAKRTAAPARAVAAKPAAKAGQSPQGTSDAYPPATESVVRVEGLDVDFPSIAGGTSRVVRNVSFEIGKGEIFGLVGESGSGKSMATSAILNMVPKPGRITAGRILLGGQDLVSLSEAEMRKRRGRDIGIVFQDPMMALSPVHRIGDQMIEGLIYHEKLSRRAAMDRAATLMDLVGITDARSRLNDFPHQFSGGMAQRAMIAAALICRPSLLIADEPTTALDATVQKQVLELLARLRDELGMSVLFISHDLAVVAQLCDRVAVMQYGEIVETGKTAELFSAPAHPYTRQLIDARQQLDSAGAVA